MDNEGNAERSKPRTSQAMQDIIDAAVECFDLGPEDQDAVLRFWMKLQAMEGPQMITVEEAIKVVEKWDNDTMHEPDRLAASIALRRAMTAAATNNTSDNGATS